MRAYIKFALLLGCLVMAADIHAEITGLINTGKDANGSRLTVGAQQPGWSIFSVTPLDPFPGGGLTPATAPYNTFVVNAYAGYWAQPTATDASQWISYSTPLWQGGSIARTFTFGLNFNAAAGDSFKVRVMADQNVEVYLNSVAPGNRLVRWGDLNPLNYTPFQSFSPWLDVAGLQEGQNTLFCVVGEINQSFLNPTGLRVEFAPIPEPTVPAFLACGVVTLWVRRKKLRRL